MVANELIGFHPKGSKVRVDAHFVVQGRQAGNRVFVTRLSTRLCEFDSEQSQRITLVEDQRNVLRPNLWLPDGCRKCRWPS